MIRSESNLARLAIELGGASVGGPLSAEEKLLVDEHFNVAAPTSSLVSEVRQSIESGADPLGEAFLQVRDAVVRRADGAVYTPEAIVRPMVEWVLEQNPNRVVDPGAGSGRFVMHALSRRPDMAAIAVDLDPLAALMTRANVAVRGFKNVRVLNADYAKVKIPNIEGRTAYIGNPPYVRHHELSAQAKARAKLTAVAMGHEISGLAGLHAHFFLYTALLAKSGDVGCFVTSSEWLDVNYGEVVRKLLVAGLGAESIHVVAPEALPFEGTQTTAVVTTFKVGEAPDPVRVQDVRDLVELSPLGTGGRPVNRKRFEETRRWSGLLRTTQAVPAGLIELGEICRVHRGTVTGSNETWVRRHGVDLPASVLFPSVTRARELFAARDVLRNSSELKLVVDIPADLDELAPADRRRVDLFMRDVKKRGVDKGYIASHRRAWWSVGLKAAAPILATYMARQPPAFVVNAVEARHINIAHGLYPREALTDHEVNRLAEALRMRSGMSGGRVYAGGLTKFEPREMERLLVPNLTILSSHEPLTSDMDA